MFTYEVNIHGCLNISRQFTCCIVVFIHNSSHHANHVLGTDNNLTWVCSGMNLKRKKNVYKNPSVLRITNWHLQAYPAMTNGDREERIFLSHPHTNNGFFILLTTKYLILYWKNMKKASKKYCICRDVTYM